MSTIIYANSNIVLLTAQGRTGKMVVTASSFIDEEGLSMRHTSIVLPKSPCLTPVAAEKLISVSFEVLSCYLSLIMRLTVFLAKTLYDLYVKDRKRRPKHLLLYRCNGQDSGLEGL